MRPPASHLPGKPPLLGRARRLLLPVCTSALVAAPLAAADGSSATARRAAPAGATASTVSVTVDTSSSGRAIPRGFLGLSIEYWAVEAYAGKNPGAINPVLVQLIRNLTPGQSPVIRVGGASTDRTWWPNAGVKKSPGVSYTLSRTRLQVIRALAQALGARLIMGVEFELRSEAEAASETRAMLSAIGKSRIQGFELGNEPDLYAELPWYQQNGKQYFGRPTGWGLPQYLSEFTSIAKSMGNVPLAGPAVGSTSWLDQLGQQLSENPRMVVATPHKYPLQGCAGNPTDPDHPTIPNLLAARSSQGIAQFLQPYVGVAHAHHAQIRDGEINTVTCGSGAGVSNTFASALWALDTLFEMANVGMDGVNMHSYPTAPGELFKFQHAGSRWSGSVEPEYYGMLTFAQAAPAGSRLISASGSGTPSTLRVWATRARDGTLRVVLINEDTANAVTVSVHASGPTRPALLARLEAPSVQSTSGVRIAGQSISSRTSTGKLTGRQDRTTVKRSQSAYTVSLPAASAAMLTIH